MALSKFMIGIMGLVCVREFMDIRMRVHVFGCMPACITSSHARMCHNVFLMRVWACTNVCVIGDHGQNQS